MLAPPFPQITTVYLGIYQWGGEDDERENLREHYGKRKSVVKVTSRDQELHHLNIAMK
jgi:hypothetical protein